MDTNQRLQERGQALAQAAREQREQVLGHGASAAGATTQGGFAGERLAQETTGEWVAGSLACPVPACYSALEHGSAIDGCGPAPIFSILFTSSGCLRTPHPLPPPASVPLMLLLQALTAPTIRAAARQECSPAWAPPARWAWPLEPSLTSRSAWCRWASAAGHLTQGWAVAITQPGWSCVAVRSRAAVSIAPLTCPPHEALFLAPAA